MTPTEINPHADLLHDEFPPAASESLDPATRREFLKLMGASLSLAGLSACTKQPVEQIVPYIHQPESVVLGKPLFFATAMPFLGHGLGVLVKCREGRPIKIQGNPQHPASLGATNVFGEASVLDLYDPDRARSVTNRGRPSSWDVFFGELNRVLQDQEPKQGAGLHILTDIITSPTLEYQLKQIQKRFPQVHWYSYDAAGPNFWRTASRRLFERDLDPIYDFDKASVILSLDSDFLFLHPGALRYTRDFIRRRTKETGREMSRLYVAENTLTITGTNADHRLPLLSRQIIHLTRAIARKLGVSHTDSELDHALDQSWINAVVEDLKRHQGAGLVIAGAHQPPDVHWLVHQINHQLGSVGSTVSYIPSVEALPATPKHSIQDLTEALNSGRVDVLVLMRTNPVYNAPADLRFADHITKAKFVAQLSPYHDESTAYCHWHIPESHFIETWGDLRAFDGTASIFQPSIEPLYATKSSCELLDALLLQSPRNGYEIVRDYWNRQNLWSDFEKGWRRALHDGLIAGSQYQTVSPGSEPSAFSPFSKALSESEPKGNLEITFRPDPTVLDGRFSNNAWLQELPKPVSKITWENAAFISPLTAEKLGLAMGDIVELQFQGRTVRAPVWMAPGQADGSVTVTLGYGRTNIGRVGGGRGFDAGVIRPSNAMAFASGLEIKKTGKSHTFATTQHHYTLEGRNIARAVTLDQLKNDAKAVRHAGEPPSPNETLYDPNQFKRGDYAWGMVINLGACTGCNACVTACYAENNIPVVGKDQVARGREMAWIRVDSYIKGSLESPEMIHQPVPCMHCENAPCEQVCPVAATVHDSDGLNLQVYNRCVGTRYCSNNCPYKVRRFNFLSYSSAEPSILKLLHNPEVTVRSRGVMEKCTYCVQRIAEMRIEAEKENRLIRDGELQTACQQACPAEAIVFGNIQDPESAVSKLRSSPLHYAMLEELNTRPRTTYLAKLKNPNPDLTKTT